MDNPFKRLMTDEDLITIHELAHLAPSIKNKIFSLGRDSDRFVKLLDKLGKPKGETNGNTKEVSGNDSK